MEEKIMPLRQWGCEKEADEAIMRNDYSLGIFLHECLLKEKPNNARALYHLGYAYGMSGDHRKEVYFYKKAIALGFKEEHVFFNLAMAYGELNHFRESIEAFEQALRAEPDNVDCLFGMAMAYRQNGNLKQAEHALLRALKIDPEHFNARIYY
ncbi:MAG: tetratricopeptide repeat protein [Thermodesulfobacteriota bacterium]|nr:tetratricopeptide repeat protein [Thermodesulfobacteriota bacterium]